jgi:hypothetical protein
MKTSVLIAVAAVAALLATPALAEAQQPPTGPPGVRPTAPRGATADTLRDSSAVRWATPDSVMAALLGRRDLLITRYQGASARFDARTRSLQLLADSAPAAVQRGTQLVVSDSGIFYRQSTGIVATGGRYILSDPSSGQGDIRGVGSVDYNLDRRSVFITGARFRIQSGEMWYVDVDSARVTVDSAGGGGMVARGADLTSCEDSVPHYHFQLREFKRTAGNTIIGRNAVLFLRDVPVAWLPFLWQNTRGGRTSGMLTPRFGVSDIVRNSPSYRRNIENLGYYVAISDYMDVASWVDWRSGGGGGNTGDPGWVRGTAEWQYQWLNRFLSGRAASSYTRQGNGSTNLALSLNHAQQFRNDGRLNISANYASDTRIQRQNTFDPVQAMATIQSSAQFSRRVGPAALSLGATRRQYPGRDQVDQTFPSISITSSAIGLGNWLSFTPSLTYSLQQSLNLDQPGVTFFSFAGPGDSTRVRRSSASSSLSFGLPLQLFGQELGQSFAVRTQRNRFPEVKVIEDVRTGDTLATRFYAETYRTDVDWTPRFQLPSLGRNRFNLSPSVSLQNVDAGSPYAVRTERTGTRFVTQSKRPTFSVSASPTVFGLFPGIGPFQAVRHAVSPTLAYSYAPRATLSDEFLAAQGRTRRGYLGALRQNAFSLGLNQVIEGKLSVRGDTTGLAAQKVKLLSLTMSPLTYDIERLTAPEVTNTQWWRGLTSERFNYQLRSDLLPGIDFSVGYSLFQGSTMSDTAVFRPHRENVSATLNLSRRSNPFAVLARMFGQAVPEASHAPVAAPEMGEYEADAAMARELAAQPVAGARTAGSRFVVPPTQGWRAALTFSSSSPRAPVGGNVQDYDPRVQCERVAGGNSFLLDACLAQQRNTGIIDQPIQSTTGGGIIYRVPPTTNMGADVGFNLTERWVAAWRTNYDFVRNEFASHVVSFQRDLHDWRAIFAFSQSPNGNFAFNFSVGLKAQPDLKFDYNRNTVRSGQGF